MPTRMEEYQFDLSGYTIVKEAIDSDHVCGINDWIDALPPLQSGQWHEGIDVHAYGETDGTNLQNIIEAGEIFERLIDHPSWIGLVRHYLGQRHRPFIHEGFLNVRGPAGYIGMHSGGHIRDSRNRSGRNGGQWCCSYLTLLVALTDVGPEDGPTVLVPGSHKSDFPHPMQIEDAGISKGPGEKVEGAVEIYMKAGDALLINDYLCHGSAERTSAGERRMAIFRYVPEIYGHRFGYVPSDKLLSRLTPQRREIVQPIVPRRRPANANP